MPRLWPRLRAVWRVLWRSHQLETDMQDEMRFHVEMETERLVREHGLDPQEARRQAYVRFGGVEKYKEAGRDARGRQWLDAIALDARFGVRMLVKHRGLSLIGGFAMAVTIAIGATFFEVMTEVINPALPLEEGERVVAIQNASLNDFLAWRETLESVEQLGAFRTAQHNLVSGNALPDPIRVAEMTASGFAVARTAPHVGRYLLASDEGAGASPVVVIGYQTWQSRFAGDPQIVGRTVTLADIPSTVIGVMPRGFRFPIDHQFWIPLRTDIKQNERGTGPTIHMFGRLASGVTIEAAQAQLTTIAPRAAENAGTQERVPPMVVPYTRAHTGVADPGDLLLLSIAQLLIAALTVVVAVNLAILVYARTVTRLGEIAVRTALGANRRRILAQLFTEALALTGVGAAIGLMLAAISLGHLQSFARVIVPGGVPFWVNLNVSFGTALYALALAAFAAVIMGVLPGLKATGRRLNANLHELNERSGTRLGLMWTTLVVAQVAVAVAVLPASVYIAWQVAQLEIAGPGFAAEKIVIARAAFVGDGTSTADPARIAARQLELVSRLKGEPGVAAASFSSSVPGLTAGRRIQFEDPSISLPRRTQDSQNAESAGVGTIRVAVDMFDVYEPAILAGRAFTAGDLGADAAIVNRTFVETLLPDRNPLGVRFRLAGESQPGTETSHESYQIVGVVRDFPSFPPALALDDVAVAYLPTAPGKMPSVMLSVRFHGSIPAGFIDRVRAIGAEVDPSLQLHGRPLTAFYNEMRSLWRYVAWGLGLVTISVLLLSAAGIYALLSFTIAQRTREIGIRVALGAHPRPLLFSIFAGALRQLGLGVLVGSVVSAAVFSSAEFELATAALLLVTVVAIMSLVALIAALGPSRRTLRMQATDALKAEA
jgi:putative ABC transport system permease protein